MGEAKTAGVAFFSSSSFDADLKAFKWAIQHLKLSDKYKLRIIHVDELNNESTDDRTARERDGSRYEYYDMETKFKEKYPDYKEMAGLQSEIMECKYQTYICGVTYEGANSEAALQLAVDRLQEDEGLDTLVLAWWAADDDTNKGPPINKLESKGCSIVLANVNPVRKLTFFMPPTQGKLSASKDGSAGTAAALSSDTASAPSNEIHSSSTLSKENTQHADGRETAGTVAAPPTKGSLARNTGKLKRSNNAQPTTSGSETDTRRSGGGEKDTGHGKSA